MSENNSDKRIRLNKLIADSGLASRRHADRMIEEGQVTVNGKKVYSSVNNQNLEQTTKEYNVNLPKGVYIVTVKSDKGAYTQKLIIK